MTSNKLSYFNDRKNRDNFTTSLINDIQLQLINAINHQLKNFDDDYYIVDYPTIRAYWYKLLTNTPRMRKDISANINRRLLKQGWLHCYRFADLCKRLNINGITPYNWWVQTANPFMMKVGNSVFIDPSIADQINDIIEQNKFENFELTNTAYACVNNHTRNRFIVIKIDFKITNQNRCVTLSISMNQEDNNFDPIIDDYQLPYRNNGNIRYADSFMASLKRAMGLPAIFINLQQIFAKPQQTEIELRSLNLLKHKPLLSQLKNQQTALTHELSVFAPQTVITDFNNNMTTPQVFINIPEHISIRLIQIVTNLISMTITPEMFNSSLIFMINKVNIESILNYANDSDFNIKVAFSLKITTDENELPRQYDYETYLHLALDTDGIVKCSLNKCLTINENNTNTSTIDYTLSQRAARIFNSCATDRTINVESNQIFMFIKSAAASIADPLRLINQQPEYSSYPKKSLSDHDFRKLAKLNCPAYRFSTKRLRFDQTQTIKELLQAAITCQLHNYHSNFKISSYKDLENCVRQYNPIVLSTKFVEFNADWQKEFNISSCNVPVLDDYYLNFQPVYSKTAATPSLILLQPSIAVNTQGGVVSGICRVMFNIKNSESYAVITYMYAIRISKDAKNRNSLHIDLQANPVDNCDDGCTKLVNEFGITCKSFDQLPVKLDQQFNQLMHISRTDKQHIRKFKELLNK